MHIFHRWTKWEPYYTGMWDWQKKTCTVCNMSKKRPIK